MKIELKNVQVCDWMSEETTCFQASLWIDGAKAARVKNDGHGGSNVYDFNASEKEKEFRDFCRAQPPVKYKGFGNLRMSEDLYIGILLAERG